MGALTILWGAVLPLVTSYTVDICTAYALQEPLEIDFSVSKLWHSFWNGLLECIVIVTISVGLSHIWDGILRDARQVEQPAAVRTNSLRICGCRI